MKRIISLCCIVLILFTSMAAPVRAVESVSSGWINVLDFATANDSGTNMVYYTSASATETLTYNLPDNFYLSYVDILFRTDSTSPQLSITGESLTVEYIGNDNYNLYRAYGHTWAYNTYFTLNYTHSDGSWVDIVKIAASSTDPNGSDIDAYCSIVAPDDDSLYEETIHFVPTDDINHRIFSSSADYENTWFISYIWTNQWKKYDYIDFQLMFDVFEITSVSAVMGSTNVPLEVSYIDGSPIEGNSYYVSFRMDVSGLDRSTDDYPMIIIHGRLNYDSMNSIDFANCSGGIYGNVESSLSLNFKNLKKWIQSVISSVDLVRIEIVYQFSQLSGWLVSHRDSINQNVANWFSNLYNWLESHTNNILYSLNLIKVEIIYQFSVLGDRLESAIRGDTSSGDSFQQQVDRKDQEFDDMAAVMDSVNKPDIESFDVSVDQYVSQADLQVLASPMTVFFEADIFSSMIIMSILLATVSYVLYGKR